MSERPFKDNYTSAALFAAGVISRVIHDNYARANVFRETPLLKCDPTYANYKLLSLMGRNGFRYDRDEYIRHPKVKELTKALEQRIVKDDIPVPSAEHIMWIDPYDDLRTIFKYLSKLARAEDGYSPKFRTTLSRLMREYSQYVIPDSEILGLPASWRYSRDIVLGHRGEAGNLVCQGVAKNRVTGPSDFPVCALEVQVAPAVVELNRKGYFTRDLSGYSGNRIINGRLHKDYHQITLEEGLTPSEQAVITEVAGLQYCNEYPPHTFFYIPSEAKRLIDIQRIFMQASSSLPTRC